MLHLTHQEKQVLLFIAFVFVFGVGLRMFQKATGCNFCLIDLYSDAPGPAAVDVNTATREELIAVPGIGEKTADAILRLRAGKGRITDLTELTAINGINDKKLAALRDHLTLKN